MVGIAISNPLRLVAFVIFVVRKYFVECSNGHQKICASCENLQVW